MILASQATKSQADVRKLRAPVVYVIDSDRTAREEVRSLLDQHGCLTKAFAIAARMLDELDKQPPDLLITAVDLQDIDGVELLQRLRQEGRCLPVIAICSRGDVTSSVRAMRAGAVDCLEKPNFPEELLWNIRQLFPEAAA